MEILNFNDVFVSNLKKNVEKKKTSTIVPYYYNQTPIYNLNCAISCTLFIYAHFYYTKNPFFGQQQMKLHCKIHIS